MFVKTLMCERGPFRLCQHSSFVFQKIQNLKHQTEVKALKVRIKYLRIENARLKCRLQRRCSKMRSKTDSFEKQLKNRK